VGPRFRSRPTTKNGVSAMLRASFSAIESMALFCTQVTSAVAPAGRRLRMTWKIVVDFPGKQQMTSTFRGQYGGWGAARSIC
jgi:hypothetical protein